MIYNLTLAVLITQIACNIILGQCNANIIPCNDASLAYRSRGNRCEGFYRANIASNALRLVSVTCGEFRFLPQPSEIIEVRTNFDNGQIVFSAEGIPNDLFYRLDCSFAASSGFYWPVKDVLLRETRTREAKNIGLLASLGGYYLPVQAKGRGILADPHPQIIVKLVASTRINKVIWCIKGQKNFVNLPPKSIPAGQCIIIRLPNTLKGKNIIEVRAQAEDQSDWFIKEVAIQN